MRPPAVCMTLLKKIMFAPSPFARFIQIRLIRLCKTAARDRMKRIMIMRELSQASKGCP